MRLVVLADPRSAASVALAAATLEVAASRRDVEVVAVVDAAATEPLRALPARTLAGRLVRAVSEPGTGALALDWPAFLTGLRRAARRHGVPVLTPPGRDLGAPALADRLSRELRPDAALTLMVAQVYGPALLAALRRPVNLHNGLLPAFRGMGATAWSVYEAAPRSGFSVHRMSERVDRGPVLLDGAVPAGARARTTLVERAKLRLAAQRLGAALDRVAADDAGRTQAPGRRAFTTADLRRITAVGDPSRHTWPELERRVRAFGRIDLRLGGRTVRATSLRPREGSRSRAAPAFTTADGVRVEVARIEHLPPALDRPARALLRR